VKLVKHFVNIVLTECRPSLDIAEYHCLILLIQKIAEKPLEDPIGIQTLIGSQYSDFSPFTVFSASFVDAKFARPYGAYKNPSTIAEYMLLRRFEDIPSIL